MRFAFMPHSEDAQEVFWIDPILDQHGMPLVNGYMTSEKDPPGAAHFQGKPRLRR
jgi:hypothetical protein